MDALKTNEVQRMSLGGNAPWKSFFTNHSSNTLAGRDFDSCTIAERYDSEAGEEWKERLTAKVEGTEYVPSAPKPRIPKEPPQQRTATPPAGSGRNTPLSRITSPPQRTASPSQKARNEAYFAAKGNENASRPADLPPSQGGKYAGFGSAPPPDSQQSASSSSVPSADEFQKDPVAALTKGFGWLSSSLTKQAASVNRAYIQPSVKSLAEADFAAQARATAAQLGSTVQQGTKGLGDQFSRFVDPDAAAAATSAGGVSGSGRRRPEPEKKDFWDAFGQAPEGPPREKKGFWDDFAAAGEVAAQQQQEQQVKSVKPTSIGTAAMRNTGGAGGAGTAGRKEDGGDAWGDW